MTRRTVYVGVAAAALLLAGVVSLVASSSPDGLERVAHDQGIAKAEREHVLGDGPLAEYGVAGVDDPLLSGALAGVSGVLVVLALTSGVVLVVRRRGADDGR
ncbi:MAG: PDGLE domain-containing protein [Actinomycetota bacterium]|nr:PDGLE domain-containing protein [Actinomycetota bacterium]